MELASDSWKKRDNATELVERKTRRGVSEDTLRLGVTEMNPSAVGDACDETPSGLSVTPLSAATAICASVPACASAGDASTTTRNRRDDISPSYRLVSTA